MNSMMIEAIARTNHATHLEHVQMINEMKKQRKRSVFDVEQLRHLENVFEQITHYPDLSLRQHLSCQTQLPDKKIQIWFQNRRAKWRKQHQLGHFGGLHELTLDGSHNFVPAPKSNFILSSPTTLPIQQLEHYFYLAFQTALAKSAENPMKRYDSIDPSRLLQRSMFDPTRHR